MKLTRIALALAAIAAFSPAWAAPGTAPTSGTTATPTGDKATAPMDKDKTAPMDKTGAAPTTTSTTTTTTAGTTPAGTPPATTTENKGMEGQPGMQTAAVDKGIELPAAADRLRAKGVPEGEVTKVLNSAKSDKIPAADAAVMVDKLAQMPMPADKAALNDFGSVVKEQLDAGLRGDALVTAVKSKLEVEKAQDQMKGNPPGMAPMGTTPSGTAPSTTTPSTKPAPAPVDKNPEHK